MRDETAGGVIQPVLPNENEDSDLRSSEDNVRLSEYPFNIFSETIPCTLERASQAYFHAGVVIAHARHKERGCLGLARTIGLRSALTLCAFVFH